MGPLIYASATSQEYEKNINVDLKWLQHFHLNKFIFSYLNIISIRNKFGDLDKMVDGNIDILCTASTSKNEKYLLSRYKRKRSKDCFKYGLFLSHGGYVWTVLKYFVEQIGLRLKHTT